MFVRFVANLLIVLALIAETQVAEPAPPRGYSIPLIDLGGETQRQVVVDREPGQYLGHPTTVLLEDRRTMIVVYPKGHGRGGIVMKRSADGGLTWSERLPTPENWKTSTEVPTIYRVVDRGGVKRLIMFSGLYPIRLAVSADDGATWSQLEPIGEFGGIVAMGCLERLKDGSYMALFHDDGRFIRAGAKAQKPPVFTVYKTLSEDGGLTWGEPQAIATHSSAHLCEPGILRSPDGRQLAVLLRENSRALNSFVIFSDDEGRTWTAPRELPGALTGDRHVGRYAPDGRLFITFRDTTRESSTQGDWVAWVGAYDDIVAGREGQYRVRLMDNTKGADCAYAGLELLPDGTFVSTTYGHWTAGEQPYIVSVRLKLAELDQKAATPSKTSGQSKPEARELVEAIVNHNPMPNTDRRGSPPVFDPNFDEEENFRCWKAVAHLAEHAVETMPELIAHLDDKRYCATFLSISGSLRNWTVGNMCREILGRNLAEAYYQHLTPEEMLVYARLRRPEVANDTKTLKTWCEARKSKKLYEMQIEACNWAIAELETPGEFTSVPVATRKTWTAAIKKQIAAMQKSKTPISYPGFGAEEFSLCRPGKNAESK